jgi:hypothetical protein
LDAYFIATNGAPLLAEPRRRREASAMFRCNACALSDGARPFAISAAAQGPVTCRPFFVPIWAVLGRVIVANS